ncbi:MAG: hypothetical protein JST06_03835 [Bacteroidetes bacterium]|nr:hypothetical protein [Bacteroidota bacterium]MBS1629289.1 hypothetical protein [Bacteroidota bacterium]
MPLHFEKKSQPLASRKVFYGRMAYSITIASSIMLFCLLIGVTGYHYSDNIAWIDAVHNASMILSGMGPVVEVKSTVGKIFSSCYALFSGVVFITNIGIILAPAAHRLFHRLHVMEK